MAVVNAKSQIITDLDATPVVKTNPLERDGKLRTMYGTAEFLASDATSVARMVRIPSSALVHRLEFASDDLGVGGTVDIGLHNEKDGTVVDADFFGSAIDTDTAALAFADRTYESAVVVIENAGKALWQQLGLTVDPEVMYDVTVTRLAATGTGTVAVKVEYVYGQ